MRDQVAAELYQAFNDCHLGLAGRDVEFDLGELPAELYAFVKRQCQRIIGTAAETIGNYRRFARGNTLFRQNRAGRFEDVSVPSNVTMGRWAWSSLFADINNDGWLDILVADGHVTGVEPDDL